MNNFASELISINTKRVSLNSPMNQLFSSIYENVNKKPGKKMAVSRIWVHIKRTEIIVIIGLYNPFFIPISPKLPQPDWTLYNSILTTGVSLIDYMKSNLMTQKLCFLYSLSFSLSLTICASFQIVLCNIIWIIYYV